MEDALNATQLRARLYRVLDEVIATGQPQRLVRKGHSLLITLESSPRRLDLDALPRRRAGFGPAARGRCRRGRWT